MMSYCKFQVSGGSRLLPEFSQTEIKRDGNIRWLQVDLPPDLVWTYVREFWPKPGFWN